MRTLRNEKGSALLYALVALAIIPPAILLSNQASSVVRSANRSFIANRVRQEMYMVRDFLQANAKDVDSDGYFELLKEGTGNTVPAALPVNPNDVYGTGYKYCTWDIGSANGVDATYSQNFTAPPHPGQIGRLISAGLDKSFQTACSDATAKGDDIVVDIYDANVKSSNAGIAGWTHIGTNVALLNPTDNVGLGVSLPTHKLELAAGTTPASGIAVGDVEVFRSSANTLALNTGNNLNIMSGTLQANGATILDASNNLTSNSLTVNGGTLSLTNGTSNDIIMSTAGLAPPSTVARSVGTKFVLYPSVGGGVADYAIGVDSGTVWQSVGYTTGQFKWYGGSNLSMTLDGAGHLGLGTAPNAAYAINANGPINSTGLYINGVAFTGGGIANGTVAGQTTYWNGTAWAPNSGFIYNSGTGAVNIATGDLQMGGVSVINSSRNLVGLNLVGENLLPAANNVYNLGSVGAQWANTYSAAFYQNGNKVMDTSNVTGTANYVAKFTGTNAVGNSLVYDNGTNVGIGTATPGTRLAVTTTTANDGIILNGSNASQSLRLTVNNGAGSWNAISQANDIILAYGASSTNGLVIAPWSGTLAGIRMDSAGNVGIGTSPAYLLDVAGNTRIGGGALVSGNTNEIWTQPQTNGLATMYVNYRGYSDGYTQPRSLWVGNGEQGNIAYFDGTTANVGIGTTTPLNKLHVARDLAHSVDGGQVPADAQLILGGATNANQQLRLGYDSTHNWGFIQSTVWGSTSNPLLLNPNGGNVGIGMTNPQQSLSINGYMNVDQAGNDAGGTGSGVYHGVSFGSGSGEAIGSKRSVGGNGYGLDFYTNWQNQMSITNAGNVGVGTSLPTSHFQIVNGKLTINSTDSNWGQVQIANPSDLETSMSFTSGMNGGLGTSTPTHDAGGAKYVVGVGPYSVGPQTFGITNDSIGSSGGLYMTYGGNVGVGTTNPLALLAVGSSSQFQVSSSGAIAAAAGISSSGTINFSGLGASGVVFTDASKNLTTSSTIGMSYLPTGDYSSKITSGTYGVNITGNAATVSNVFRGDSGSSDLNTLTTSGFYRINGANPNAPGTWGQLLTVYGGADTITQIYGDYATGSLSTRSGNPPNVGGSGVWTGWHKVLDSANYTSYVPSLTGTGASGTWGINITGTATNVTGVVGTANGGTGVNASTAANGTLLIGNGSGFTLANLAGTANQVNVANGAGTITLSLPQSIDSTATPTFAGLKITSNGTVVWAPTAARTITLPDVSGTVITTGNLSAITSIGTISSGTWNGSIIGPAYGGTGLNTSAAANGTLLIGNGSGFTLANLTAGTGIGVTNAAGSITINNTGVTSLTGTTNQVNVSAATGGVTLSLPQNIHSGATPTFAGLTLNGNLALGANTITITNTSVITNLNADMVDGYHMNQDVRTSASPSFAGLTVTGTVGASSGNYSATTPTLWVGDSQYGVSSAASTLYFHNKAGGGYAWRNAAETGNVATLDNSGNLATAGNVSANGGNGLLYFTGGEGETLKLVGSTGTNVFLENLNGTFRLLNSGWTQALFTVDQNGLCNASGNAGSGFTYAP